MLEPAEDTQTAYFNGTDVSRLGGGGTRVTVRVSILAHQG